MKRCHILQACIMLSTLNGCMGVETEKIKQEGPHLVKLTSGLQYTILKEAAADAKTAQQGNYVAVHYTGWLSEQGEPGKKFDSSVDRGQPFKFLLGTGQVIKGWDEGVAGMKVGEKRRLIIPSELGYGVRGAGNTIPGNATLIFDVELLAV